MSVINAVSFGIFIKKMLSYILLLVMWILIMYKI